MLKRLMRPALAVIFIGLAIWQTKLLLAQLAGAGNTLAIETGLVKQGPFEVGVTREGILGSADEITVQVPEMLRWRSVITWIIPDGTKVKKGQVLAKLDVTQYRFEVDGQRLQYRDALGKVGQAKRNGERDVMMAESEVERSTRSVDMVSKSLQTEMEQAQAQRGFDQWNVVFAETDWDKQKRLKEAGIVPPTEVEQSERSYRAKQHALTRSEKEIGHLDSQHKVKKSQVSTDIDSAKFNLELTKRRSKDSLKSSQDQVKMTKQWLDQMEENLASGEIKAPAEGLVVLGNTWDQGGRRTIREGDRSYYSICNITDPTKLRVNLWVDEAAASKFKVGQEVTITAEGVPGRSFRGRIATIGAVARIVPRWENANVETNQRIFDVTVKILEVDPRVLRPGMKAKAKFVSKRLPKSIFVPLTAVIHRPGRGEFVYVEKGARFEERKVTTGERNDEAVVILKGIGKGERVALSDPTRVGIE